MKTAKKLFRIFLYILHKKCCPKIDRKTLDLRFFLNRKKAAQKMMYGFSRTGGLGDPPIPYIKLGKGIINVSLPEISKEIYSKIN
ncbi:hypothetical protein [Roseburia inulinivorans]|nr:hypothetical protein [Roseburia inulinivorans]